MKNEYNQNKYPNQKFIQKEPHFAHSKVTVGLPGVIPFKVYFHPLLSFFGAFSTSMI